MHTENKAQSGNSLGIRLRGRNRQAHLPWWQPAAQAWEETGTGTGPKQQGAPKGHPAAGSARWEAWELGGVLEQAGGVRVHACTHARDSGPGLTQVLRGVADRVSLLEPSSGPAGGTGGQDHAGGCCRLMARGGLQCRWPHIQWQPHSAAETQGGVSDSPARLRQGRWGHRTLDPGPWIWEEFTWSLSRTGWGRLVGLGGKQRVRRGWIMASDINTNSQSPNPAPPAPLALHLPCALHHHSLRRSRLQASLQRRRYLQLL